MFPSRLWICSFAVLLAACTPDAEPTSPAPREPLSGSRQIELEGTSWRLVRIQSMDDRVFTPDDRDKYTLDFGDDGRVAVRADCNRGSGAWHHEPPSGLTIGPVALTRMACPPDSIEGRFAGNLDHVRSFVLRDGHLFLATMADGAILELEPIGDHAEGPAFDCTNAEGQVEQLICRDAELAAFDVRLDSFYRRAVESYPAEELDTLKAFQRGWIKGRNDCWKADDVSTCVRQSYRVRITELQIGSGALEAPQPVGYSCNEDESITASFYEAAELPAAVLTRVPDDQVIAYRVPAASGAKYEGRNVTFWTKGDEATVTWMGRGLRCTIR